MRAATRARRDAIPAQRRLRASVRIQRRVLAHAAFARARVVMAYWSFGSELDTSAFIAEAYARGKTLVLPRVDRERDALALFDVRDPDRDLAPNAWGIREPRPDACRPIEPTELDFVLVPGLAFDARGGRLGYGKAYYDRMFHACRREGRMPFTVAGAFEAQIVERVPMEAHDVAIGIVVTERHVHRPADGGPDAGR